MNVPFALVLPFFGRPPSQYCRRRLRKNPAGAQL